jgi:hypothetical protein
MSFEDLEKHLRHFFHKALPDADSALENRVFSNTMKAFGETKKKMPFWQKIFAPRTSLIAFSAVSIAVLFNVFPGNQGFLSAGEISPKYGPVEILRGEDMILVEETMKLHRGDIIRIGNKAEADIFFPDRFSSTLKSKSQLRVVDGDSFFLEKGLLTGRIFDEESEISTARGFIKSTPGGVFSLKVSESGETEVTSEKKTLSVFDWKEGQAVLSEGEILKLRTDTSLSHRKIPSDLNLSFAQIQAIRAKLIIARTKALTAVEKALSGDDTSAKKDIASAHRSFLSIAQVLDASRDLEIMTRKNLDTISMPDVLVSLREKNVNAPLFKEAKAVKGLLAAVQQNFHHFGFALETSPFQSFNRFVLLKRIFAFDQEKDFSQNVLKQKYVVAFLRDVLDEEIRIDQISQLNQKISLLPITTESKEFLWIAKNMLSPDLADMLAEKIDMVF